MAPAALLAAFKLSGVERQHRPIKNPGTGTDRPPHPGTRSCLDNKGRGFRLRRVGAYDLAAGVALAGDGTGDTTGLATAGAALTLSKDLFSAMES
mgnify:CR=1 FL=1